MRNNCENIDHENINGLTSLPKNKIVTAAQLRMKPGQKLSEKAKELGVTAQTLRIWHAEWRGSQYDPDYLIERAGHDNWLRNKWKEKDWTEALRQQITKQQHRHVGDICIELGLTAGNAQHWSQRHAEFEKLLWHSGVPNPPQHWRDFICWVRHATIDDYRKRKAKYIAAGMDEVEAMHTAAEEAVNEIKHKTRQRRRVERDTLLGVTIHEEQTRRWQKGGKLWDAHSRRIAKQLVQVGRFAAMERGLRAAGYDEKKIASTMAELVGAFEQSPEAGQAQWQKVRKGILRKKAHREAKTRADRAEAKALKQLPGVKATKYVKQQITTR